MENSIVVGDSVWDLLAGLRKRALGVGLLSGGYGQEELERAGPSAFMPTRLICYFTWNTWGCQDHTDDVSDRSRWLVINRLSDNVGGVKFILSTVRRALMEERHFALVDGLRVSNLDSLLNRSGQELGPTQPSFRSFSATRFLEPKHST